MTTLILAPPQLPSNAIMTNCPIFIRTLCLKYGKYITKTAINITNSHTIKVLKTDQTYEITYDTTRITTSNALQAIEDILYSQRSFHPDIFALHGAAIAYNNQSTLFLAATTSGKTTLTSYLVNKGYGYITDDCILLNRRTFNIHPYNTPLHLRSGGLDILRKCQALPNSLEFLDDPSFTRYVYTPTDCVTTPLPLGRIFFITRTDCENRIEEMTTTERMTELLKAPITEYPMNSEHLQFIARLAKFPCHRLFYSDMNYVQEVIRNG